MKVVVIGNSHIEAFRRAVPGDNEKYRLCNLASDRPDLCPSGSVSEQVCLRSRDAFWDIQVPKTHSIFDSLLCSDRPAVITIAYRTLQLRCSCTTPS